MELVLALDGSKTICCELLDDLESFCFNTVLIIEVHQLFIV